MLIKTYFGDVGIIPGKQKEHFTIIPRRDIMSGKWIWLKNCISVEHSIRIPDSYRIQKYYFTKENWLQTLLSNP